MKRSPRHSHHRLLSALLPLVALGLLFSCRTTEANYRKAYETAVEKRNEAYTSDEVARINHEEAIPKTLYKGDSIPLRGRYVNTLKTDPPVTPAKKYSVVVASFKQKFNANSVATRLREQGYTDVRILVDRDNTYFVAATSFPTLGEAVASLETVRATTPVPMRSPFPYILQKP